MASTRAESGARAGNRRNSSSKMLEAAAAPADVPITEARLYDAESGAVGGLLMPVATCERAVQARFLKKVYTLLTFNVAVTTFFCILFTMTSTVRMWMWHHPWLLAVGVILFVASFLALAFVKVRAPWHIALLVAFVLSFSLGVAIVSASYYHAGWGGCALQMCVASLVALGALTMYVIKTNRDFSVALGVVTCAVLVTLVVAVMNFGTTIAVGKRMRTQYFFVSVAGALGAVGYLVYDTMSVMHRFAPDDWLFAVVAIYTDVPRFFIYLWQRVAASRS